MFQLEGGEILSMKKHKRRMYTVISITGFGVAEPCWGFNKTTGKTV